MAIEWTNWDEVGVPELAQKAWANACGHYFTDSVEHVFHRADIDWREFVLKRRQALYDLYNGSAISSPIEQILSGWLPFIDADWLGHPSLGISPHFEESYKFAPKTDYFGIAPQVRVGAYRVDFLAIIHGAKGLRRLGIECDGHEFHERTKEQAARDKKRDRELLLAGIPIMRFTGSELNRDPAGCFGQLQQQLADLGWDVWEMP